MHTDAVNFTLLALRVVIGLIIVAHGWNHLLRTVRHQGVAEWFESLGLRPGPLHAWMVSATELGGGALLALGLLTPLAAASIVALMVVAFVTTHRTHGFFIFRPGQGWEYVATLAAIAAALGGLGPGDWSLDDALGLTGDLTGWNGLLIAVAVGVGGALAFLAAFWRPPRGEAATT